MTTNEFQKLLIEKSSPSTRKSEDEKETELNPKEEEETENKSQKVIVRFIKNISL